MHPILRVGSLLINSWGFLGIGACVVFLVVSRYEAPRRSLSPDLMHQMGPYALLGGIAGAHLYWLAVAREHPSSLTFTETINIFRGSAIQGGFIGGALAIAAFLRWMKRPLLPVLDVASPGGALAQGITRVGCFMAGCCYGRPTRSWLGVAFFHPLSDAPRGIPLHPAQLYEAAGLLGLAAFLHRGLGQRRILHGDGFVFGSYLAGYGVLRFLVQFFRGDDSDLLWGLTHSQYTALAMLVFGLGLTRLAAGGRKDVIRQPACEVLR